MLIENFDFGAEDARNLNLRTDNEKRIFLQSYVRPRGFRLEDFFEGRKYFIYGPKGSGKSTILRYIQLHAEYELGADTSYYYFQTSFPEKELNEFVRSTQSSSEVLIDDTPLSRDQDAYMFWRVVLLAEISRLLKRRGVVEGAAEDFHTAMEAAKLIAKNENVGRASPAIEKFQVRLSRDPATELQGTFAEATPQDLLTYLDVAEDALVDVYLENNPIFLIVDELEIFKTGDARDKIRLLAVASLVRAVRDFNERLFETDIRIIAAVRSEVVDEVSTVQGEIYRIVSDKGLSMGWHETVHGEYHPLKRIVLHRLIVQDDKLSGYSDEISESYLRAAEEKYFPGHRALDRALNLTWFRPRDISLLFEEAARIDGRETKFRSRTLTDAVLKPLGRRLWHDAVSGLAVKYTAAEVEGVEILLRGWKTLFTKSQVLERFEDLANTYDCVARLADHRWVDVFEDLYEVGAVYVMDGNGRRSFYFRGDEMPAITDDFRYGVHDTLIKTLNLK